MICLLCAQSPFCTATLILYTCIWIPFLQIKHSLLRIIGFIFRTYQPAVESYIHGIRLADLPVARYQDLLDSSSRWGNGRVDEMCSVCLVEFEREDVVSQLSRCGHVFHTGCIEGWLHRNHFTCPLCRSFLLNVHG
ncbi:hypothetical protein L1049_015274 [Liquidambar formosana]|uniref:RING-type domain-containing protein n=1 Tax=Liquidambar formosana TaxID=63359 RepID=A0AAP0X610_LIQFO